MKILIVSQYCWPEPDFRIIKVARKFVEVGHDVQIVTTFPNYPIGKIYPNYKSGFIKIEINEGVKILRYGIYYSHNKSSFLRSLTYLTFLINGILVAPWFIKKPDVIFSYTPPITTGLISVYYKLIYRAKLVLDVQDIWPDSILTSGFVKSNKSLFYLIARHFSRLVYSMSDKLICITNGYKELLISRGFSDEKLKVIYNWANEDLAVPTFDNKYEQIFDFESFIFMYTGNIGKGQDLEIFIDAIDKIETSRNFKVVFIGEGTEKENLMRKCQGLQLDRVVFIPRQDQNIIESFTCRANVLIATLQDHYLSDVIMPSKIQSYLKIGKPILYAGKGEVAYLIKKANCGIVATRNPKQIMESLMLFLTMDENELQLYGLNAKKYYKDYLSFEVGFPALRAVIEEGI